MARSSRLGGLEAFPDVKLAASNCTRVVLDAYTIALRYAHDKDRAFDVAVRAWRLHNRSFPPDVAAREVAAIIQNKQAGSDRPNAVVHGKIGPASSLRRQP